MHIYDPRFRAAPSWPIALPYAPVAAYRTVQRQLGVERAVVVQPNGYAFDNACTEDALRQMGGSVRGIATVRRAVSEAELERLSKAGFRGARCHMLKGGYLSWDDVDEIAARVVIDHNGKFLEPVPTSDPSFKSLLRLFSRDNFWVKLSAPYETSKTGPPRYDDVSALARALVAAQPDRCVWASNWPHPGTSPTPSNATMLDLLLDWAPDETLRYKILVDNPARLYGFAGA